MDFDSHRESPEKVTSQDTKEHDSEEAQEDLMDTDEVQDTLERFNPDHHGQKLNGKEENRLGDTSIQGESPSKRRVRPQVRFEDNTGESHDAMPLKDHHTRPRDLAESDQQLKPKESHTKDQTRSARTHVRFREEDSPSNDEGNDTLNEEVDKSTNGRHVTFTTSEGQSQMSEFLPADSCTSTLFKHVPHTNDDQPRSWQNGSATINNTPVENVHLTAIDDTHDNSTSVSDKPASVGDSHTQDTEDSDVLIFKTIDYNEPTQTTIEGVTTTESEDTPYSVQPVVAFSLPHAYPVSEPIIICAKEDQKPSIPTEVLETMTSTLSGVQIAR